MDKQTELDLADAWVGGWQLDQRISGHRLGENRHVSGMSLIQRGPQRLGHGSRRTHAAHKAGYADSNRQNDNETATFPLGDVAQDVFVQGTTEHGYHLVPAGCRGGAASVQRKRLSLDYE